MSFLDQPVRENVLSWWQVFPDLWSQVPSIPVTDILEKVQKIFFESLPYIFLGVFSGVTATYAAVPFFVGISLGFTASCALNVFRFDLSDLKKKILSHVRDITVVQGTCLAIMVASVAVGSNRCCHSAEPVVSAIVSGCSAGLYIGSCFG